MIDVARNVCARDHARCETRRGRDVCVWTKRVFLNAKSSIESRKKCRMASHFLERFSQKRDEIIEYAPTFQGRQKMIKCVRSSRKDLAALERDRTKRESVRSTSLFLPPKSSFVLPKVGVSEACERSPARRRTSSSSSESDRISFFSFFFSLTARTVLTQFFSLSIPQTYA